MNRISKTHQLFSDSLRILGVLESPEDFLGPNYKEVLNFWLILDELSEEQLRVVKERYSAFYNENRSELRKAANLAWETAEEVVGVTYANEASCATYDVTISDVACRVTPELIAMHKILEDHQQPLTFFEMFLEVL